MATQALRAHVDARHHLCADIGGSGRGRTRGTRAERVQQLVDVPALQGCLPGLHPSRRRKRGGSAQHRDEVVRGGTVHVALVPAEGGSGVGQQSRSLAPALPVEDGVAFGGPVEAVVGEGDEVGPASRVTQGRRGDGLDDHHLQP